MSFSCQFLTDVYILAADKRFTFNSLRCCSAFHKSYCACWFIQLCAVVSKAIDSRTAISGLILIRPFNMPDTHSNFSTVRGTIPSFRASIIAWSLMAYSSSMNRFLIHSISTKVLPPQLTIQSSNHLVQGGRDENVIMRNAGHHLVLRFGFTSAIWFVCGVHKYSEQGRCGISL